MSATATGLRQRNKQRRVEQILEATRELLREWPGESPSAERIAERAEVAPATVFNLIGPREKIWAALADGLLAELQRRTAELPELDPLSRARAIADATVEAICGDADVYRHVLAHWSLSGRFLRRDPTPEIVACLQAAVEQGTLPAETDTTGLGEMITTTCTGAAHQWAAGLIDDRTLRDRCRAAVDLTFAAASAPRVQRP